jgi:hypothetical protein
MVETPFVVAGAAAPGRDVEREARRVAAAWNGRVEGAAGGVIVAFAVPQDAVACAEALAGGGLKVLVHSSLLAADDLTADPTVAKALAALSRVGPGAMAVSTALKARLPSEQQIHFGRQILVEGWLPAWSPTAVPPEQAPTVALPARVPAESTSRAYAPAPPAEPGVGEVLVKAVGRALDSIDRALTRSPSPEAFHESLLRVGRPLSVDEVADLHHITRGRARELLKKAVRKGRLDVTADGTYQAVSEAERLRRRAERRRSKLRDHVVTYGVVNAGLFLINAVSSGLAPPWFLLVAAGWGMALFFDWRETARAVEEARAAGVPLPPPPAPAAAPALPLAAPALPEPWGGCERGAQDLLEQLAQELRSGGPEDARLEEMLAGYRGTVGELARQGVRIDGILGRFDRARLTEELAEARRRMESAEDARLATSHFDRAQLLENQLGMLARLQARRETTLLKLKNVLTTVENLLLEASQGALEAREARVDSVLESGVRDLAQYRSYLAEAMAEIDRLLK